MCSGQPQHCTGRASVSEGPTERDEFKTTLSDQSKRSRSSIRRIRYHFPIPSTSSPSSCLSTPAAGGPTRTPHMLLGPDAWSTNPTQGHSTAWGLPAQSSRWSLHSRTGHFHLISQTGSYNTLTLTCLKRGLCDPKGHSQPRTNQYGLSKSTAAGQRWDHLGKHLCVLRANKTIKSSPAGRGIPHPDVPNIPPGSTCRKEFRYVGHGSDNTVQLYSSPTPTNAAALRPTLQQTLC